MTLDEAKRSLGLEESATTEEIVTAIKQKRTQAEEKIVSAPTAALKAKFEQMLKQLDEVECALASAPAAPRSPLTQTKLADLPGAAPGGSQSDVAAGQQLQLQPGDVLASRYEIKEQIGVGGMGAVYRAHDSNRNEDIAIKVLLPSLTAHERARERFLDEARLSSKLSHPNIVNVFDVQQDGELYFITMELLEGQDLRGYLENLKTLRQPVPLDEALRIVRELAEGLHYAHEHTVHRDIKPENIWLSESGKVKVMDFGIARLMSTSQRTQTGAAMGTAYYMAPEQLQGRNNIDGRADQYALGVLLYEMLSGQVPAGRIEPLSKIAKGVPKRISAAVDKALSPNPDERYPDMAAFASALKGKGAGVSISMPTPRIDPRVAGIAAGVMLLIGVGVMAASGNLGETLKGLLPESEEVIQARKMEVITLQARVKAQVKQLAESERNFDGKLRELESEQKRIEGRLRSSRSRSEKNALNKELEKLANEIEQLDKENRLLTKIVFEKGRIEIEGQVALADSLIRDNEYKHAKKVLTPIENDLKRRMNNVAVVATLLATRSDADTTRKNWLEKKPDNFCDEYVPLTDIYLVENKTDTYYNDCLLTSQVLQYARRKSTTATEKLDAGDWEVAIQGFKAASVIYSGFATHLEADEPATHDKYLTFTEWDMDDIANPGGTKIVDVISQPQAQYLELWHAMSTTNNVDERSAVLKKLAAGGNVVAAQSYLRDIYSKYNNGKLKRNEINDKQYRADYTEAMKWVAKSGIDTNSFGIRNIDASFKTGMIDRLYKPANPPLPLVDHMQARAFYEEMLAKPEHKDDMSLSRRLAFFQYNGLGGEKDELAAIEVLTGQRKLKRKKNVFYFSSQGQRYAIAQYYAQKGDLAKAAGGMRSAVAQKINDELVEKMGDEAFSASHPEAYAWLVKNADADIVVKDELFKLKTYPYDRWGNKLKITADKIDKLMAMAEATAKLGGKHANAFLYSLYNGSSSPLKNAINEQRGDQKDLKKGFHYLRVLAEEISDPGYFDNMSRAYFSGRGVKKNSKKGMQWLIKYADNKQSAQAFNLLGYKYINNEAVRNDRKAYQAYMKAYELDNDNSTTNNQLGYLYYSGRGVRKNLKRAHEYFLVAARKGNNASMEWVANNYLYGRGVKKSTDKARYWARTLLKKTKSDQFKKKARALLARL